MACPAPLPMTQPRLCPFTHQCYILHCMQAAGRPKTSADVNHCLYLHIFPDTTLLCPLAWRQGTSMQNAHWVSRCCTHQRLDAVTMSCACECSTRLLQQHPKTREREDSSGRKPGARHAGERARRYPSFSEADNVHRFNDCIHPLQCYPADDFVVMIW
jgi:hypothetical protein